MQTIILITVALMASVAAFAPVGSRFMASKLSMASIVETAAGAGSFNSLVKAVEACGLKDTLSNGGRGAFTVFAPTDAAFDAAGGIDNLLKDTNALKDILLFHVVNGEKNPSRNGLSYQTLHPEEKEISVKVTVGEPVQSLMYGGDHAPATVVNGPRGGIACDNGVIHVLDSVLIPYEGTQAPT